MRCFTLKWCTLTIIGLGGVFGPALGREARRCARSSISGPPGISIPSISAKKSVMNDVICHPSVFSGIPSTRRFWHLLLDSRSSVLAISSLLHLSKASHLALSQVILSSQACSEVSTAVRREPNDSTVVCRVSIEQRVSPPKVSISFITVDKDGFSSPCLGDSGGLTLAFLLTCRDQARFGRSWQELPFPAIPRCVVDCPKKDTTHFQFQFQFQNTFCPHGAIVRPVD